MQLEKVYTKNNIPIEHEVKYVIIKVKMLWIKRIILFITLTLGVCVCNLIFAIILVGLPRTVG
jgi:hypothetical protein